MIQAPDGPPRHTPHLSAQSRAHAQMEAAWLAVRQSPPKTFKAQGGGRAVIDASVAPHAVLQVLGEHEAMRAVLHRVEDGFTQHNMCVGALDMGGSSVEMMGQRSEAAALRLWELVRMPVPRPVAGHALSAAGEPMPRDADAATPAVLAYYVRSDAYYESDCPCPARASARAVHKTARLSQQHGIDSESEDDSDGSADVDVLIHDDVFMGRAGTML